MDSIEKLEENNSTSQLFHGDCLEVMKSMPSESVDLIMTSPPYADARKKNYGGISPDNYVEWFLPRSEELFRVLKSDGTFILNIKERVSNGERHTYVLELILALKAQGWLWTEEFIWHKKSCAPGKWPNRFRDAWERCLQFNKIKKFNMYQDDVKVPIGDWSKSRLKNLSGTDRVRDESAVESGFGKNVSNWEGKETVYPSNVLHLAAECGNKSHSAAYPESLPTWFIKLFSQPSDTVFDPFIGSGTTGVVATRLNRNFIGIDSIEEYVELSQSRIEKK